MSAYIWIVEILGTRSNTWFPTVGAGLCRKDARWELARWRRKCPDDKFRLAIYVRNRGTLAMLAASGEGK